MMPWRMNWAQLNKDLLSLPLAALVIYIGKFVLKILQEYVSDTSIPFKSAQSSRLDQTGEEDTHLHGDTHHAELDFETISSARQGRRALAFFRFMNTRRSVRFFSPARFPKKVLLNCIRAAGASPSGAHQQPWHFCIVLQQGVKVQLRRIIEAEEEINYSKRMGKEWVGDIAGMVSKLHEKGFSKPYLTDAPYVVVMFRVQHTLSAEGAKGQVYYSMESCGIAAGIFIAALHSANLVTLTSTPLGAYDKIRMLCRRPENEKVFLVLPVGRPATRATVPFRDPATRLRKRLREICSTV